MSVIFDVATCGVKPLIVIALRIVDKQLQQVVIANNMVKCYWQKVCIIIQMRILGIIILTIIYIQELSSHEPPNFHVWEEAMTRALLPQ